ncbi:hypothetical protein PI125_g14659 [Phytophthora idaei]|nr:hypothetical protein PI125_g14659 [Phytophthora idaei]KAG3145259.1 hypothetical protein PI126_g13809 [Phytophthora idaei]
MWTVAIDNTDKIDDETTGSLVPLGPVLNLNGSAEGSLGGFNKGGRESAHDLASAHLNGATPRIAATISAHGVRAHAATKVAASDVMWPLSPSVATTATPLSRTRLSQGGATTHCR